MTRAKTDETIKDAVILLLKEGILKGRHPKFYISSNSMSPVLNIGEKVSVKEASLNSLICGDIVIYKVKESLIAHRFLYLKDNEFFITKGDNTLVTDKLNPKESLIGKIYRIEKKGFQINLESKLWRITNILLGKALICDARNLDKNIIIKIFNYLKSRLLKFIARVINLEYRKISQKETNSLSLEKEFLKISSQKELTEEDIAFLSSIAKKDINWEWISILAEYNSIAPIVYINLSKLKIDFVPEDIMDRLKSSYMNSFLKTAPVYNDVAKLLKEFNANNIKVIILKGCSLGELIYQDFSLRPMKDVDILIKKENWPQIKEILNKFGFRCESELDILKLDNLIGIPVDWQVGYENDSGTKLEFKFTASHLDFPDFVNIDKYWKEAIPCIVGGSEALSLSIEDQILLLSCRLINVGFRNLLWFCDLRELIKFHGNKINWRKLIYQAKIKRVTVFLYYTFSILKERMGVDLPQEVIDSLRPGFLTRWLFEHFYGYKNMLFRMPEERYYPYPLIAMCLVFGKVKLTLKDMRAFLIYCKKLFFPSKEYIYYRYKNKPVSVIYAYYLRINKLLVRLALLVR